MRTINTGERKLTIVVVVVSVTDGKQQPRK